MNIEISEMWVVSHGDERLMVNIEKKIQTNTNIMGKYLQLKGNITRSPKESSNIIKLQALFTPSRSIEWYTKKTNSNTVLAPTSFIRRWKIKWSTTTKDESRIQATKIRRMIGKTKKGRKKKWVRANSSETNAYRDGDRENEKAGANGKHGWERVKKKRWSWTLQGTRPREG